MAIVSQASPHMAISRKIIGAAPVIILVVIKAFLAVSGEASRRPDVVAAQPGTLLSPVTTTVWRFSSSGKSTCRSLVRGPRAAPTAQMVGAHGAHDLSKILAYIKMVGEPMKA